MQILTVNEMRRVEEKCARIGLSPAALMENAGKAVAEVVGGILCGLEKRQVVVLVGPGNNGGDGLVAARYLHEWGAEVNVCLFTERVPDDPNLKLVSQSSINLVDVTRDNELTRFNKLVSSADAVIDALFGTGKIRPLDGLIKRALVGISHIRNKQPSLCIIAIDVPSGLNADNGTVDDVCLYVDATISLGFPKRGLFYSPGMERAGKLTVADIGIPSGFVDTGDYELITADLVKTILPLRPKEANKGSFGRAMVIAGSQNYIGAAYLACMGALRVGSGLVTLAIPTSLQPVLAAKLTEVTYLPLPEIHSGDISLGAAKLIYKELPSYNAMLIGCGLGQSGSTVRFVRSLLLKPKTTLPSLVVDADALNILAGTRNWWQQLADDVILTPHPGEMARLVDMPVADIQSDRVIMAKQAALVWRKTVVLKGAHTVIASPDGRCRISALDNPGLASAGTGDVLSGIIAGLLAQGLNLFDAASSGVFLHSEAGDIVRNKIGDCGMIATDLLPELPVVIKNIKESRVG
ncbi:NAD(P)H-hydrate dehydratase [Chloroflexota bacterium]